jgi:glycerate 2-kinase
VLISIGQFLLVGAIAAPEHPPTRLDMPMPDRLSRRYLIAPDSFKGTLSAVEVAEAMAQGVRDAGSEADVCPAADGGEGTLDALLAARGGTLVEVPAHDPLRRPILAEFGLLDGRPMGRNPTYVVGNRPVGRKRVHISRNRPVGRSGGRAAGATAVVEVAAASGLPLLRPEERDPERADTYGTGELIAAAIEAGARTVLVGAGGSATVDGGRGAIEALRERADAGAIDLDAVELEILCDVETPYEHAVGVFGPQKGLKLGSVDRMSARLDQFAASLPRDPRGLPMTGCAGGLSGGLYGAFGARLRPGARFVLGRLGFERRLAAADAVITGEGRIDEQSLGGKVIGTVAEICGEAGKPVHAIVGQDALATDRAEAAGIVSVREASTLEEIAAAARELAEADQPSR